MKDTKLIMILKKFTKEEMKNLGLFISSPYFNRERNFKPLYRILLKFHPGFPKEELSAEKLFKKLYPETKYDKNKASLSIRVLVSQMTDLAIKFLAYEQFRGNEKKFLFNYTQAKALYSKNLYKSAVKSLLTISDYSADSEFNQEFYQQIHSVNLMRAGLEEKADSNNRFIFKFEDNNLLYIYGYMFESIAKFLNDGFVRKYNKNLSFRGFELVKKFIVGFDPVLFSTLCNNDEFDTKNMILFNYYIVKSRIDESDTESLLNAVHVYYVLYDKISFFLRNNYFVLLLNRLIGRRNLERIYSEKANELIDFAWKDGIFGYYDHAIISLDHYRAGLNFKAYLLDAKMLNDYINKYVDRVLTPNTADLRNYSLAFVYFKEKSFVKCIEIVTRNESLGPDFKGALYKLKICSLFELKYYEEVLYTVNSFEKYIRRTSGIGPYNRTSSIEFIKHIRLLLKVITGKIKDYDFITSKIRGTNKFSLIGDWFNEKCKDFEVTKNVKKVS